MAARAGGPRRVGGCPGGGGGARLTKTEMLRQAKSAAVVQKDRGGPRESTAVPRAGPSTRPGACPGQRTGLAKLGPPPADPKKLDFKRPGMTKAMQMRQKLAMEKIRKDEEMQRRKEASKRCPQTGRAKAAQTPGFKAVREAVARGHVVTRGRPAFDQHVETRQLDAALDEAIAGGHIVTDRRGAASSRKGPAGTATPIPEVTKQLARSMNAEIVQATPMSDGPIDKIIIPPGTIHDDRNTIVCIAQHGPSNISGASGGGASQLANKSIQVISDTLDQQDAAESAAVQEKLEDLQQARREFVMSVANVGGNAINIGGDVEADEDDEDDGDLSILDLEAMPEELSYMPSPPRRPKVFKLPDVSHDMFRLEYGRDHPDILAARQFSRRAQANLEQREAERRIEEEFARVAAQEVDDVRFDVPFAQDIMEGDISFEEDEEGNIMPCPSRIKASMPPIPRRTDACPRHRGIGLDELERFFNLERYPPAAECPAAPPPGREALHPDLWQLEDPWYREATQPDQPDLMRFDSDS